MLATHWIQAMDFSAVGISSRLMLWVMSVQFAEREYPRDKHGNPKMTAADDSNPWWKLLTDAVAKTGGKLSKPEIFFASTDCRYVRQEGIPAFGFSPMANTPVLLHDHNEVYLTLLSCIRISFASTLISLEWQLIVYYWLCFAVSECKGVHQGNHGIRGDH